MSYELQQEYALRFEAHTDYRKTIWKILTRDFFSRWVAQDAAILDLGCGWGEFVNQIKAGCKYGIDLNPDSAEKLNPDVTCFAQDCSAPWPLPDVSLDVVFTSNFFEHLPTKEHLRRTLGHAFRCLKPGGAIICLGPNIKFLPGPYWDFWDHHLPLTEASLGEALRLAGFELSLVHDRFLPYSMSQGFTPPPIFLRVYLRCPPLWRFFGRQFLLIARKPESH